jgi:mono/diheme cytochrome c family protein
LRKALKLLGIALALLIVAGLGFYGWASSTASRKLARTYTVHTVDFPIPFPLPAEDAQRRGLAPAAADTLAREQAFARGKHLLESRYACTACHGADLSGGTMIDVPAIGRILGPNLTGGRGGRTAGFRAADFDRIVRHGVKPDGLPALMPSVHFRRMSDQELSDIIVVLQSRPPVDHIVPPPTLGPVGKVLLATGKFRLSADLIGPSAAPHATTPPAAAPTVEFGRHLASTCMGCHGENLAGGPIVGGDPSWPPAANLTPAPGGIGGWTLAQFDTALRQGKRPDGRSLAAPMAAVVPYARNLTEVELEALWKYLRSIPPVPASPGS